MDSYEIILCMAEYALDIYYDGISGQGSTAFDATDLNPYVLHIYNSSMEQRPSDVKHVCAQVVEAMKKLAEHIDDEGDLPSLPLFTEW